MKLKFLRLHSQSGHCANSKIKYYVVLRCQIVAAWIFLGSHIFETNWNMQAAMTVLAG